MKTAQARKVEIFLIFSFILLGNCPNNLSDELANSVMSSNLGFRLEKEKNDSQILKVWKMVELVQECRGEGGCIFPHWRVSKTKSWRFHFYTFALFP